MADFVFYNPTDIQNEGGMIWPSPMRPNGHYPIDFYATFDTLEAEEGKKSVQSWINSSDFQPGKVIGVAEFSPTQSQTKGSAYITYYDDNDNPRLMELPHLEQVESIIDSKIAGAISSTVILKGNAPSDEFTAALTDHNAGWTFIVTTAGTYVGQVCEVGDWIVCKTTGITVNNSHWFVIQKNLTTATSTVEGTIKLTDSYTERDDAVSGGKAATPKAVNDAYLSAVSNSDKRAYQNPKSIATGSGTVRTINVSNDVFSNNGKELKSGMIYVSFENDVSSACSLTIVQSGANIANLKPIKFRNADLNVNNRISANITTPLYYNGSTFEVPGTVLEFADTNDYGSVRLGTDFTDTAGGAVAAQQNHLIALKDNASKQLATSAEFSMEYDANNNTFNLTAKNLKTDDSYSNVLPQLGTMYVLADYDLTGSVTQAPINVYAFYLSDLTEYEPTSTFGSARVVLKTTDNLTLKAYGTYPVFLNQIGMDSFELTVLPTVDDISIIYSIVYGIVSNGNPVPRAEQLNTARSISGMVFNGTEDVGNYNISTAAKNATTIAINFANFKLTGGAKLSVKFTNGLAANAPSLNVNNAGSRKIKYRGRDLTINDIIPENSIVDFVYDQGLAAWSIIGVLPNEQISPVSKVLIAFGAEPSDLLKTKYENVLNINIGSSGYKNQWVQSAESTLSIPQLVEQGYMIDLLVRPDEVTMSGSDPTLVKLALTGILDSSTGILKDKILSGKFYLGNNLYTLVVGFENVTLTGPIYCMLFADSGMEIDLPTVPANSSLGITGSMTATILKDVLGICSVFRNTEFDPTTTRNQKWILSRGGVWYAEVFNT